MGSVDTATIAVAGMHCGGCANTLGSSLGRLDGVVRAEADVGRGEVMVRFDPDRVTLAQLQDGIRAAGFDPA